MFIGLRIIATINVNNTIHIIIAHLGFPIFIVQCSLPSELHEVKGKFQSTME